jgi:uncharacterized membrane protein YeaQ/YmgE (transglycosylase-associated protein family)
MFSIIGWLITGWIAGSMAEWLIPNKTPTPGWQTIATGVAGSIVGGVVYSTVYGSSYSPAGMVWSCAGAVLCLIAYRWYTQQEV